MKPLEMLVMSLSGRCNLACEYCYAANAEPMDMTWDTARKAIDIAAASGERFILQITGGEPLLHFPLLRSIYDWVGENKLPACMQIQTNGTLINDEIAAFLQASKIAVGVSLDGRFSTGDRHRRYPNGGGASSDAAAGIQRLAACGVEIGITYVVTAENVDEVPGIVEMAYYLGNVRQIGFDLLRGQGRGRGLNAASSEAVARAMEEAFARADAFEAATGRRILFAQTEQARALASREGAGFSHCHAMNGTGAYVDATGRFFVCPSLAGDEAFLIGDVEHGIDEQKQCKVAGLIYESMRHCRGCRDFRRCGGACFARWYGGERHGARAEECALKRAAIARACHHG